MKVKTEIGSAEEQPIRDILSIDKNVVLGFNEQLNPIFLIFLEMLMPKKNLPMKVFRPSKIHQ